MSTCRRQRSHNSMFVFSILAVAALCFSSTDAIRMSRSSRDSRNGDPSIREAPATNQPVIRSEKVMLEVKVGVNVSLPCEVDELAPFVLLWRRKEHNEVLYAGRHRVSQNDRMGLAQSGNTLNIAEVTLEDSGNYYCQVSTKPPVELHHKLVVLPVISSEVVQLRVKEGEEVSFPCSVSPTSISPLFLSWVAQKSVPNDQGVTEQVFEGIFQDRKSMQKVSDARFSNDVEHTLTIKDVKRSDTGFYMCQINSDPKVVIKHHLQVVTEAELLVEATSSTEDFEEPSVALPGTGEDGGNSPGGAPSTRGQLVLTLIALVFGLLQKQTL